MIHLKMLLQETGAARKVQQVRFFTCPKTFFTWADFCFLLHDDDKEEVEEEEEVQGPHDESQFFSLFFCLLLSWAGIDFLLFRHKFPQQVQHFFSSGKVHIRKAEIQRKQNCQKVKRQYHLPQQLFTNNCQINHINSLIDCLVSKVFKHENKCNIIKSSTSHVIHEILSSLFLKHQ